MVRHASILAIALVIGAAPAFAAQSIHPRDGGFSDEWMGSTMDLPHGLSGGTDFEFGSGTGLFLDEASPSFEGKYYESGNPPFCRRVLSDPASYSRGEVRHCRTVVTP